METPERLYDRQWCLTLLAGVLEDVREDYEAAGKGRLFDRLKGFLTGDDDAGPHAEAARDLGMTADAVKVAVHRLRRRYRDALRSRVGDTVETDEEVDDEIQHLLKTLGKPASL
jgi:RNA polymerase sigma-70 factor (ECF subfamily)